MPTLWGKLSIALVSAGLTACGGNADDEASPLSGVVAVSSGFGNNCALLEDGNVSCWGLSAYGLPEGTMRNSMAPVVVPGASGAVNVSVGWHHACAALQDGSVRCWGRLHGDPMKAASALPVDGLTNVRAVVAGELHTCALGADGAAWCWGTNSSGQLGCSDECVGFAYTPEPVAELSEATALTTYADSSCALVGGGRAKCWGSIWHQDEEAASDADGVPKPEHKLVRTPQLVDGLEGATSIDSGAFFTCAGLADSSVACWGLQPGHRLTDDAATISATPIAVPGLTGASAVAVGNDHACALLNDGTVRCWGRNGLGQLGDGSETSSSVPVLVRGIDDAIAIAAGWSNTCAVLADRTVRCWGYLALGCSGGRCRDSSVPVVVHAAR